jgi:hypothetical protein
VKILSIWNFRFFWVQISGWILGTAAIHSTISSTGLTFLRWDGTIPNCTTKPIRPFQGVRRALKPCCDLPRFQHASDLGLPKILQQLSSHHHWYRIFLFARGRSKRWKQRWWHSGRQHSIHTMGLATHYWPKLDHQPIGHHHHWDLGCHDPWPMLFGAFVFGVFRFPFALCLIVGLKEILCNRKFPWPGKFIPMEDQSTFQCRNHVLFRKLT